MEDLRDWDDRIFKPQTQEMDSNFAKGLIFFTILFSYLNIQNWFVLSPVKVIHPFITGER